MYGEGRGGLVRYGYKLANMAYILFRQLSHPLKQNNFRGRTAGLDYIVHKLRLLGCEPKHTAADVRNT